MPSLRRQDITAARDDIDVFARLLTGQPLFAHQLELARDGARIRSVVAGRQAGKTRTLAMLAAHTAFRQENARVLIVSSGETAAKRLLADVTQLVVGAPLLAGSVVDELSASLRLSNGSTIESVPASIRQVRSASVDLMIVDEAAFLAEEIFTAASFTMIARPGSRLLLASSPWGARDRFFAKAYDAGREGIDGYSSFHWPSTVNPLVDEELLGQLRATMTDREYRMEVLGEWVDAHGAWFAPGDLERARTIAGPGGFEMFDPADFPVRDGTRVRVDVGVDWGYHPDANAVVLIGAVPDWLEWGCDSMRWVPWFEEYSELDYDSFIGRVVELGAGGFEFDRVAAETNGVGAYPTQDLRRRIMSAGRARSSVGVTTTTASKEAAFSFLKVEMQRGRLALPNDARLLRQLANLEYEQLGSGSVRIAVPERRGHDDLAMALAIGVSSAVDDAVQWRPSLGHGRWRVGRTLDGVVRSSLVWDDDERLAAKRRFVRSGAGAESLSEEQVDWVARRLLGLNDQWGSRR